MSIHILSPGLLTTVQDGGRFGHATSGIGVAGAMDTVALRLANTLVGNAEDLAALEMTLRGPRLRFDLDSLIACTGAEMEFRCGNQVLPNWRPLLIRAGSEVVCGGMPRGARAYFAIAGGIDLAPLLGSRSTDVNAQLGPIARALAANDVLPTRAAERTVCADLWHRLDGDPSNPVAFGNWSIDPADWFDHSGDKPIHAIAGRHFDGLDTDSQRALFGANFRVGVDSNRVGCRLEGFPLTLRHPLELISAGNSVGTVQLPPGGTPIALTCEAPPTGGYPCIAQVISVDQGRLAQRRAGDPVRFAQTDQRDAQMRYLAREQALTRLRQNVLERLKNPW
jgi:antagonist of KipI